MLNAEGGTLTLTLALTLPLTPTLTLPPTEPKAGGVALNLTVASRIFLMDPWWNPAAEYQAIDRAHRLGQHKPIRAVRHVTRDVQDGFLARNVLAYS